jgi:hypothetical protein
VFGFHLALKRGEIDIGMIFLVGDELVTRRRDVFTGTATVRSPEGETFARNNWWRSSRLLGSSIYRTG